MIATFAALALVLTGANRLPANSVQVVKQGARYVLLRNGKPFFIRGVGGDGDRNLLVKSGANSFRTWGAENLGKVLDDAQKQGLMVTAGIWLPHSDVFDYHDSAKVEAEIRSCEEVVRKFKDHPALLMWAFGNEMEAYGDASDPALWKAVNEVAVRAKRIDPNHPAMTVVAELGGQRVPSVEKYCPAIDVLGINSYAGAPSLVDRYRKGGGTKPIVLTEFGPPGPWESGKTAWGAAYELSSTDKANRYRDSYQKVVADHPELCLGSYAFLWGHKKEGTATWFGIFLTDGARTAAADTLREIWTGKPAPNLCPRIDKLTLSDGADTTVGKTLTASLEASDPEREPLRVQWTVTGEMATTEGGQEATLPDEHKPIRGASPTGAKIEGLAPGNYRLFVRVYDRHGGAATANVPFRIRP